MPFTSDSFNSGGPFFFINYDEDYFWRPENQPTAMADPLPSLRPTLLSRLDPRNLLVKRAWAHGSHGTPTPPYYHGKSLYISRFRFSDAHEGNGTPPEMVYTIIPTYRHFGSPYKSLKEAKRRYSKATKPNTDYPKKGQKYPEIYQHAGLDCVWEVFPSGTSGYGREDWINLKWVEEDLWLNPDDKVAHWKSVNLDGNGNVSLDETHEACYGTPQESKPSLTTKPTGRNYYK